MFEKWLEKRKAQNQIKDKVKRAKARMRELDSQIADVFKGHQIIPSFKYLDALVDSYIKCEGQWEVDYCRKALRDKYRNAGLRYDDDRLK